MNKYHTKHEIVTVNHIDYNIRSLKDRQQFYDNDNSAEVLGISSATWSLFGVLWPSSHVQQQQSVFFKLKGKRVLEIGCGLGLSSIVLHKMGIDITASDYHPLAREFLDNNIHNNNMSSIKQSVGNWETENPLLGEFDLIIGSDVLYDPAHLINVSQFINCHSCLGAEVIIVDPNMGNQSKFTQAMKKLGYAHYYDKFETIDSDGAKCKGRVLYYQRQ